MTTSPFTPADLAQLNKPRGRKPKVIDATPEPDLDQSKIDNAMVVMRDEAQALAQEESQHQARVRAVAVQVGYQLPSDCTDPDLIQRDIAVNMRRSVEACLEVGRGLSVLKAACEHGQFIARLDVLSIEESVARRFMQAAMKFSNRASTHVLKAAGNQTKLFEMLVLDDEQIEELSLTGQTGELKLDDVAGMSVKELRAKVRELKGEVDAKEKLLAHKNEQLDAAALLKRASPDERIAALLAEANRATQEALNKISGELRQALAQVESIGQEAPTAIDYRPLASGLLGQLQQAITVVRDEFMIEDIVGNGVPEWVRATAHLEGSEG